MKFCDKLPKLRKINNLSQEQLADRLGVSRQAVSKWESGQSHPDMEKMNEMCKILNCTLEDLLDDGTINKERTNQTKSNFANYVNDFLKFITKTTNMFVSMTFKEKIKFLLEMAFIALVLFIIGGIIYAIFSSTIFVMIDKIPRIGLGLNYVIHNLFYLLLVLIGIVVFIHLFKIRYLDYYVTIEDQNITEKKIEEPIDKNETYNGKKEKVIIRDPKHSGFSFFECLASIIIVLIKIGLVIVAIPCIFSFLTIVILLFMSIFHITSGIIFFFIVIAILGVLTINYIVLEFIYKFIISRKQSLLRLFIMFILGLVLIGAGIGLATSTYLNFDETNTINKSEYKVNSETIKMNKNTALHFPECTDTCKAIYKIDNNENNIKLKYTYVIGDYVLEQEQVNNYKVYSLYNYGDTLETYNLFIKDIKNHKYREYNKLYKPKKIVVTTSKDNYKQLIINNKKF